MKKLALISSLILLSTLLLRPVAGQSIDSPYPGAEPDATDAGPEFYMYRTLADRKRDGIPTEEVQHYQVKCFTTADSFGKVYAYLNNTSQERFQETSKDLDPDIRSFINSLSKDELTKLAATVGSELSGEAYRRAFLAALDKTPGGSIHHGIMKKQVGDKTLYYFDVHRPFLNFRTLKWIDATHINVIREPFSLPAFTGLF